MYVHKHWQREGSQRARFIHIFEVRTFRRSRNRCDLFLPYLPGWHCFALKIPFSRTWQCYIGFFWFKPGQCEEVRNFSTTTANNIGSQIQEAILKNHGRVFPVFGSELRFNSKLRTSGFLLFRMQEEILISATWLLKVKKIRVQNTDFKEFHNSTEKPKFKTYLNI